MVSLTNDPTLSDLNQYEKILLDYVKKHPGSNGKQIIKEFEGKISKNVVSKYLDLLESEHKEIDSLKFSQGEKQFFIKKNGWPSSIEFDKKIKEDIELKKSIVKKSLKYVQNRSFEDKRSVYSKCLRTVLAMYDLITILQAFNPDIKLKKWSDTKKEMFYLLQDITKLIQDSVTLSIINDMVKTDNDDLDQLEYFIRCVEKKQLN